PRAGESRGSPSRTGCRRHRRCRRRRGESRARSSDGSLVGGTGVDDLEGPGPEARSRGGLALEVGRRVRRLEEEESLLRAGEEAPRAGERLRERAEGGLVAPFHEEDAPHAETRP